MEEAANEKTPQTSDSNEDTSEQPEEVNSSIEFKPIVQKNKIIPKRKNKNEMSKNDLLLEKALRTLNEEEDQYDVFGKYVASEMRSLSSEYLRKKMKRKFQQVILEITEEDEQLSNPAHSYSNPNSVASSNGCYETSRNPEQYTRINLQPPQTLASYIETETESTFLPVIEQLP